MKIREVLLATTIAALSFAVVWYNGYPFPGLISAIMAFMVVQMSFGMKTKFFMVTLWLTPFLCGFPFETMAEKAPNFIESGFYLCATVIAAFALESFGLKGEQAITSSE